MWFHTSRTISKRNIHKKNKDFWIDKNKVNKNYIELEEDFFNEDSEIWIWYMLYFFPSIVNIEKNQYIDRFFKKEILWNNFSYQSYNNIQKQTKYEEKNIEDLLHILQSNIDSLYFSTWNIQITPFDNCIITYDYYECDNFHWLKLLSYNILCLNKRKIINQEFKENKYQITNLNTESDIDHYHINKKYNIKNHFYLHWIFAWTTYPYIQVWKDNDNKQVYWCILNMNWKWWIFSEKIIKPI